MKGKNQKGHLSRRNILKLGAGAVGTGVLTAGLGSELLAKNQAVAEEDLTPDQSLQRLIEGNQRFINGRRQNPHQDIARLIEVAKGQKPFAAILGCADSRVPSEIIFDQGFGDLFVCRLAGNIATQGAIGSLEFAVLSLGAKVIMVMGHKRCGAVDATIRGGQVPGQIASLLEAIKPAIKNSGTPTAAQVEEATKANILYQAERVRNSSVISQLIQEGKVKVVGGYYDLDNGKISLVS